MAYEYEDEVKSVISTETVFSHEETEKEARVKELQEVYRKAKAFDEVKQYALSKYDEFEDRKDLARNIEEFEYYETLQIAKKAIINKCKQLGDE